MTAFYWITHHTPVVSLQIGPPRQSMDMSCVIPFTSSCQFHILSSSYLEFIAFFEYVLVGNICVTIMQMCGMFIRTSRQFF